MAGQRTRVWCCSFPRPAGISNEVLSSISMLLGLGLLYIGVSASMITFNKYLVHEGRFPFAVPLVFLHSGFSSACALLLLLVKPSMFPSLTSPSEKVSIDFDLVVRNALPIAVLFSVQLALSNTAYLHSSMAFLQMMKESNLVLVYGFSVILAMESFSFMRARVILMICVATTLTIHGELNFSWTGFVLQGSSQLFEALKIVLQALLLSSAGKKLDVLTYVVLVMPLCFCILGSMLLILAYVQPVGYIAMPQWTDIVAWWPQLAANASLAFVLNLSIALFMKKSSAVGFIIAGIAKDAVIVFAGVLAMHEPISKLQTFGFMMQLCLILLWSLMKIFPEKFQGGILAGLAALFNDLTAPVEDKSLLAPELFDDAFLQTHYGSLESQDEKSNHADRRL